MCNAEHCNCHRTRTNERPTLDPRSVTLPLVPPRADLYIVEPLEDRG